MYYVSRISGALAVLALFAAGWFSVRFALADADFRRDDPESVARAVALSSRNTEYLAFRALQLDYDGVDSTAILERVAALNPMASAPRIRLGLAAEVRGDFVSAEKWMLDAARVDRQFEPRWTLANFYFRRENATEFWKWMRAGLDISYGDRRPAFDLCWRVSSDAQEILARAIPDRHDVLIGYLSYLFEAHRLTAAAPVALKLAAVADASDRESLLAACDAFLEAGVAASARALWIAMGYATASGVFHGSFEPPRTGHGFDWRPVESPGVVHTDLNEPRPAHRIKFDGRQPESCELLRQIVSLQAGVRYTLRWEARTVSLIPLSFVRRTPASAAGPLAGHPDLAEKLKSRAGAPGAGQGTRPTELLPSATGIEWRVAGLNAPIASSDDWRAGELSFVAPSDLVSLVLAYQRPSGQARAEGSVELTRVTSLPEARSPAALSPAATRSGNSPRAN